MRTIARKLQVEQKKSSKRTALRISVGDYAFTMAGDDVGSGVTTCQNTSVVSTTGVRFTVNQGNRIMGIPRFSILPWGKDPNSKSYSTIILNNHDKFLYGLDLKGKKCSVEWGLQCDTGTFFSTDPLMYVSNVSYLEAEGAMTCVLTLMGIMDWLNSDTAICNYNCNGTDTVETLVNAILGATLTPFVGSKAFTLNDTDVVDENYTTFVPGPTLRIKKGDTRAATLARLLDFTNVKLKPSSDTTETIVALVPSTQVVAIFDLDDEQPFFNASESSGVIRPNKITVQSTVSESTQYAGTATDNVSYLMMPSIRTEYVYGLSNDWQARNVANAILANIRAYYNASSAKVPLNYGLELYDRVRLVSKRTGRIYEGNITSIEKVYNPMESEPELYMTISFGRFYDPRSVIDSLGIGAGFVDTGYSTAPSVFVPIISYSSYTGTLSSDELANMVYGFYGRDDNNESMTWPVTLTETNYILKFILVKNNSYGILEVYLDDVLQTSYDGYSADRYFSVIELALTISPTEGDSHTIKFKTNGKNASSTGYVIITGAFILIPN